MYYNKVTRESTEWPYRFKTEDEMERDFGGEGWEDVVSGGWNRKMDVFLGRDFRSADASDVWNYGKNATYADYDTGVWGISKDMITPNRKIIRPTYNKKQLVYEASKIPRTYFNNATGRPTRWPYRFKTEDEFIETVGDNWRNTIDAGWNRLMDTFFGRDFKSKKAECLWNDERTSECYDEEDGFSSVMYSGPLRKWAITKSMIVPNESLTTYRGGELVYEATWSGLYVNEVSGEETVWPYRFKTREEMNNDFGRIWENGLDEGWNDHMNVLLGRDFRSPDAEDVWTYGGWMDYDDYGSGEWTIGKDMLVPNTKVIPNYSNTRRLVYESNDNDERIYVNAINGEETKWPCRFKTEEEFEEEFGERWAGIIEYHWNINMDVFFGKDIHSRYALDLCNEVNGYMRYEGWSVSSDMLTKNQPLMPSYGRRKTVYEQAYDAAKVEGTPYMMGINEWLFARGDNMPLMESSADDSYKKLWEVVRWNDQLGAETPFKYRIKTMVELIETFGSRWKVESEQRGIMTMLGRDIYDAYNRIDKNGKIKTVYGEISKDVLIENKIVRHQKVDKHFMNDVEGKRTVWKYRFMTEEELSSMFGKRWRTHLLWENDYDYVLGKDFVDYYDLIETFSSVMYDELIPVSIDVLTWNSDIGEIEYRGKNKELYY